MWEDLEFNLHAKNTFWLFSFVLRRSARFSGRGKSVFFLFLSLLWVSLIFFLFLKVTINTRVNLLSTSSSSSSVVVVSLKKGTSILGGELLASFSLSRHLSDSLGDFFSLVHVFIVS
jgi:hypothetical protein